MSERALVYSADGRVPKVLRDHIDGRVKLVATAPAAWDRTDFYVSTVSLNSKSERAAASTGGTIVVMPEASVWLNERLLNARETPRIFVAKRRGDRP